MINFPSTNFKTVNYSHIWGRSILRINQLYVKLAVPQFISQIV